MNKEETKEYLRKWNKNKRKDPKFVEQRRKQGREYYKKIKRENPEQIKRYREATKNWRMTDVGLYVSLRNRRRKDFDLEKEVFLNWYKNQDKKCSYCNLRLEDINKLPYPYNRGNGLKRLSIDRKDSEIGYNINNITLCCFTCNTIKNNLLSFEDMKKIGKEIIEPKLRKLLKNDKKI